MRDILILLSVSSGGDASFWQIITGHRALFLYMVILLCSVIALMTLLIMRNFRDVKAAEAKKRSKNKKRRFSRLSDADDRAGEDKKNMIMISPCRDFARASELTRRQSSGCITTLR